MKTELKTWYKSTSFALIGTLALIAAPYAATAQDTPQPLSKNVAYADLDLDTPEGARILYGRLRNAANYVCKTSANFSEPGAGWKACYDATLAKAVAQINKATLTKLYEQSTGKEKAG